MFSWGPAARAELIAALTYCRPHAMTSSAASSAARGSGRRSEDDDIVFVVSGRGVDDAGTRDESQRRLQRWPIDEISWEATLRDLRPAGDAESHGAAVGAVDV